MHLSWPFGWNCQHIPFKNCIIWNLCYFCILFPLKSLPNIDTGYMYVLKYWKIFPRVSDFWMGSFFPLPPPQIYSLLILNGKYIIIITSKFYDRLSWWRKRIAFKESTEVRMRWYRKSWLNIINTAIVVSTDFLL